MDINTFSGIPTDSLYKFVSLSGIVLIVASATIPEYFRKIFLFQLYDVRSKHGMVKLEGETLCETINKFREDINTLEKSKNELTDYDRVKISEKENYISEKTLELRKNMLHTESEINKIEYLSSQVKIITLCQIIFMSIGTLATVLGFYFWYFKLQIFLDAAISIGGCNP